MTSDSIDAGFDIELEDQLDKYIKKGMVLIDRDNIKKEYIEDIDKDIRLLKQVYKDWFSAEYPSLNQQPLILPHHDPKIETLITVIEEKLKENPKERL